VRFNSPGLRSGIAPREVVAVLRPEEVELCANEQQVRSNFVGHGTIEEILFAGAVERLRVRMASDGPVPVAPARDGAPERGSLLKLTRFPTAQFPVRPGQRIAVGAQIRILPTPISSAAVASTESEARALCESPLLVALGARTTRVATRRRRHARRRMPVVATGSGSAEAHFGNCHGAVQLLCVPAGRCLRVLITRSMAHRVAPRVCRRRLLRHVPAEAVYLGIHASDRPRRRRCAWRPARCALRGTRRTRPRHAYRTALGRGGE
jgi:hypothetical protein